MLKKSLIVATLAFSAFTFSNQAQASDGDVVAASVRAAENMKSICSGGQSAVTQVATNHAMTLLSSGKITNVRGAIMDASKALMAVCMGGQ